MSLAIINNEFGQTIRLVSIGVGAPQQFLHMGSGRAVRAKFVCDVNKNEQIRTKMKILEA